MDDRPTPQTTDVGLVFALAAEQGCFEDLLAGVTAHDASAGKFRLGTLDERTVVTVVSGPGRAAAARATEALLIGHRPRLVISAGFCGALKPELKRHDVVVADRIVGQAGHGGAAYAIEPATLARFNLAQAHVGPLVEVERIVARAADKRILAERTGGAACEMESSAVAEVCAARQTPFLAVRVVSDVLDEDLPDDLESLLTASSGMQTLGAVIGTLWRRPASIKDLLRLKETALTASDRLAKFLVELIRQLSADRSAGASRLPENPAP